MVHRPGDASRDGSGGGGNVRAADEESADIEGGVEEAGVGLEGRFMSLVEVVVMEVCIGVETVKSSK